MRSAHLSALMLLVAAAGSCLAAEKVDHPEISNLLALVERLESSTELHRNTAAALLSEGVALGRWSAEAERYAGYTLEDLFSVEVSPVTFPGRATSFSPPPRTIAPPRGIRLSMLEWQLVRPRDPEPATAWVFDWLQMRIQGLEQMRREAGRALAALAIDAVETIWLEARSPQQIAPARTLLAKLQSATFVLAVPEWHGASTRRRGYPPPAITEAPSNQMLRHFIIYWAILYPHDPLLCPSEDAEFGEFARFWTTLKLLGDHGMPLLERPAVAERVSKLLSRFRREFDALQAELDTAILRNASATDFASTLQKLERFTSPVMPAEPVPGMQRPPMPGGSLSTAEVDYREVVRERLPVFTRQIFTGDPHWQPKPKSEEWLRWMRLPGVRGKYAGWLAFREAESSSDSDQVKHTAVMLQAVRHNFRLPVAQHLEERLASAIAINPAASTPVKVWTLPPDLATASDPVAALATALEGLAEAEQLDDTRRVARLWCNLQQKPTAPIDAVGQESAEVWRRLLSQPGRGALGHLRLRAARAILQVDAADDRELSNVLRARLKVAVERDDLISAARWLAIDKASALLPVQEHRAYAGDLLILQRAADDPAVKAHELTHLIREAGARPTGVLAARKLKAIR